MSNDNETVGQVALSDLPLAEQLRIIHGNYSAGSGEFDALDEAADVVECHQREIEAKDAEIARLRALIGELTDALDGFMDAPCDSCMLNRCSGIEKCKETKGTIELVAKARKVIGGAE